MISSKGVEVQEEQVTVSKGFSKGIAQICITDYKITVAQSGKIKVDFFIETADKIDDGYDYEGELGEHTAKGKTARVAEESPLMCKDGKERMNNWAQPDAPKFIDKIKKDFTAIAKYTGTRDQLDMVEAETIEEYIRKSIMVIKDKFFYAVIKAEEVKSQDGAKTYLNRTFKSYVQKEGDLITSSNMIVKPVEGSNLVMEGRVQILTTNGKVNKFDFENEWDYKPLAMPDPNPETGATGEPQFNDLPF